jgi:hypothetical protein
MDHRQAVAAAYRTFARQEARGRSASYAELAESVARDGAVTAFVASLPPGKRQPQLLFAAARYLLGAPPGIGQLRALVDTAPRELERVVLARRTQTNEPARCAALLPALVQLPQPLALIEVGASAGLTLLFDRYSYDYAGHRLDGGDPGAPTLRCEPRGPVPLPSRLPAIAWRAGLDLNPLDVTDDDDVNWLKCLVWPGETDREQRLEAAIAVARRDPPAMFRGDLVTDLPGLAAQAPAGVHLVVFHTSVLYQVAPAGREQFAAVVRGLNATWLCSEAPGVLPGTGRAGADGLLSVLTRDGDAIGYADSHGTWVRWLRLSRSTLTPGGREDAGVASIIWDRDIAEVYDATYAAASEPSVVNPMADLLAALARDGPALEFAVGTGRVALALAARGVSVTGIELSPHMAERLRAKPGADRVPVTIGDMTTTRVPGSFTLVYLAANTIMNVTTQDEQIAVFANAAAHLGAGGRFVVEVIVPQLRAVPAGETGRVFTLDPDHVGIETFDDLVGQIAWSHHWMEVGGRLVRHSAPYRYVWPSELDLMARIAGFRLENRWSGWDQAPFTAESKSQVAVFERVVG